MKWKIKKAWKLSVGFHLNYLLKLFVTCQAFQQKIAHYYVIGLMLFLLHLSQAITQAQFEAGNQAVIEFKQYWDLLAHRRAFPKTAQDHEVLASSC